MELRGSNGRGRFWPLLFLALGVMNVVDFFHGSAYQAEDLLHGIGFLLNVPVAYFAPGVHTFASRSERRGRLVWLNGMAFAGFALLVAGFAVRWGWL